MYSCFDYLTPKYGTKVHVAQDAAFVSISTVLLVTETINTPAGKDLTITPATGITTVVGDIKPANLIMTATDPIVGNTSGHLNFASANGTFEFNALAAPNVTLTTNTGDLIMTPNGGDVKVTGTLQADNVVTDSIGAGDGSLILTNGSAADVTLTTDAGNLVMTPAGGSVNVTTAFDVDGQSTLKDVIATRVRSATGLLQVEGANGTLQLNNGSAVNATVTTDAGNLVLAPAGGTVNVTTAFDVDGQSTLEDVIAVRVRSAAGMLQVEGANGTIQINNGSAADATLTTDSGDLVMTPAGGDVRVTTAMTVTGQVDMSDKLKVVGNVECRTLTIKEDLTHSTTISLSPTTSVLSIPSHIDSSDFVSVDTFGAKGDGITDDTAAINLAMASGRNIVFQTGATYFITGTILPGHANAQRIIDLNGSTLSTTNNVVTMQVRDVTTSLLVKDGYFSYTNSAGGGCLNIWNNSGDVCFQNCVVSAPNLAAAGTAAVNIYESDGCNLSFKGCRFTSSYAVIREISDGEKQMDLIVLEDCSLRGSDSISCYGYTTQGKPAKRHLFRRCEWDCAVTAQPAVYAYAPRMEFADCSFRWNSGPKLCPTGALSTSMVANYYFDNCEAGFIWIASPNTTTTGYGTGNVNCWITNSVIGSTRITTYDTINPQSVHLYLDNCRADGFGHDFYIAGAGSSTTDSIFRMSNCRFKNAVAVTNSGGVYRGKVDISGCTFSGISGGGSLILGEFITGQHSVRGCTFDAAPDVSMGSLITLSHRAGQGVYIDPTFKLIVQDNLCVESSARTLVYGTQHWGRPIENYFITGNKGSGQLFASYQGGSDPINCWAVNNVTYHSNNDLTEIINGWPNKMKSYGNVNIVPGSGVCVDIDDKSIPLPSASNWYLCASVNPQSFIGEFKATSPNNNVESIVAELTAINGTRDNHNPTYSPQVLVSVGDVSDVLLVDLVAGHTRNSAAITAGTSAYQTFVAPSTTFLRAVNTTDVPIGPLTWAIYSGAGTGGTVLSTGTNAGGGTGVCYLPYSVLLTAGQTYTIGIVAGADMTLRYVLGGYYSNGAFFINGVDQGTEWSLYIKGSNTVTRYDVFTKPMSHTTLFESSNYAALVIPPVELGSGTEPSGIFPSGVVYRSSTATSKYVHDSLTVSEELDVNGMMVSGAVATTNSYPAATFVVEGRNRLQADVGTDNLAATVISGSVVLSGNKIKVDSTGAAGEVHWDIDDTIDGGTEWSLLFKVTPASATPTFSIGLSGDSTFDISCLNGVFTTSARDSLTVPVWTSTVIGATWANAIPGKEYEIHFGFKISGGNWVICMHRDGIPVGTTTVTSALLRNPTAMLVLYVPISSPIIYFRDIIMCPTSQYAPGVTYAYGYGTNSVYTGRIRASDNIYAEKGVVASHVYSQSGPLVLGDIDVQVDHELSVVGMAVSGAVATTNSYPNATFVLEGRNRLQADVGTADLAATISSGSVTVSGSKIKFDPTGADSAATWKLDSTMDGGVEWSLFFKITPTSSSPTFEILLSETYTNVDIAVTNGIFKVSANDSLGAPVWTSESNGTVWDDAIPGREYEMHVGFEIAGGDWTICMHKDGVPAGSITTTSALVRNPTVQMLVLVSSGSPIVYLRDIIICPTKQRDLGVAYTHGYGTNSVYTGRVRASGDIYAEKDIIASHVYSSSGPLVLGNGDVQVDRELSVVGMTNGGALSTTNSYATATFVAEGRNRVEADVGTADLSASILSGSVTISGGKIKFDPTVSSSIVSWAIDNTIDTGTEWSLFIKVTPTSSIPTFQLQLNTPILFYISMFNGDTNVTAVDSTGTNVVWASAALGTTWNTAVPGREYELHFGFKISGGNWSICAHRDGVSVGTITTASALTRSPTLVFLIDVASTWPIIYMRDFVICPTMQHLPGVSYTPGYGTNSVTTGRIRSTGRMYAESGIVAAVSGVPSYANNAAAIAGGLVAGRMYRTGADPDVLCIVH